MESCRKRLCHCLLLDSFECFGSRDPSNVESAAPAAPDPYQIIQPWIDAVQDASNGTLEIRIDPAPIAPPPQQYDFVRNRASDLACHVVAYTPGPFEIVRAIELPFLSPNAEVGSQAVVDWYELNIGFDAEFRDVKVISIMVHGPGAIHTRRTSTFPSRSAGRETTGRRGRRPALRGARSHARLVARKSGV